VKFFLGILCGIGVMLWWENYHALEEIGSCLDAYQEEYEKLKKLLKK
jgi:hypothetical protein